MTPGTNHAPRRAFVPAPRVRRVDGSQDPNYARPVSAKILVVDDDKFMQRVIVAALTPHGYEVNTASDGAAALARALVHPPDLVVSDVMMPGMDGWALVRRVRSHRQLALVPFIFLSQLNSADDVLKGFRLGADDYLPKPFTAAELAERVATVLESRARLETEARSMLSAASESEPHQHTGMRGSLADIGVSSLLVLLELEKKGGILVLTRHSPHERCRLLLRDGRVFEAHVDTGPSLSRAEVVYHVLDWPRGSFEFHAVAAEMRDEIGSSTTGLLMEAARRADEHQDGGGTDPTDVLGDSL